MFKDRRSEISHIKPISNNQNRKINEKERRRPFQNGPVDWWLRVNYVTAETTANNSDIEKLFMKLNTDYNFGS